MMSDIDFQKLQAPIPRELIKTRPGRGGGQLSYITSRVVQDRLDNVCGPQNWRNEYAPSLAGDGVQCTIFIRVDGEWIGKSDVGTESNIEEEKGAYSDALKRAAVQWGIARELYGDTGQPPAQTARQTPQTPPQRAKADLDDVLWTRDTTALDKMIDWASGFWTMEGETPPAEPHVINRICAALEITSAVGNRDKFYEIMLTEYKGSKQDAIEAIKVYEPKSKARKAS